MAFPITGNQRFPTPNQVPDHAILDFFNKQVYLGGNFTYSLDATVAGTSETTVLLLQVPATATKSLFFRGGNFAAETATHSALFKLYVNPTISAAGTAQTPINTRTASSNASVMALTTAPSVSANGNLVGHVMSNAQTQAQFNQLLILDPGQSLLLTVTVSTAADKIAADVVWYEL